MLPLWTFFLRKREFTVLLLAALTASGLYALLFIPKESAPEVRIPIGIVTTVMPGASAGDIELLVTDEIERNVANLENLSKLKSISRESISMITAEFDANADLDASIQDLKDAIDTAKKDLPEEAEDPVVSDVNFAERPILLVSVASPLPPAELTTLGKDVRDELEAVAGVSRVELSGVREREIQVILDKRRLDEYGLSVGETVSAIQSSDASLPIGTLTVAGVRYALNFEGELIDASDVGTVSLRTKSGATVRLSDIAHVSDSLEDATSIARASHDRDPSEPALALAVYKSSGGNAAAVSDAVKERLGELESGILSGADVVVTLDQGDQVKEDILELGRVGLETVGLVMITLLVTIGWREALVAGLSIPLSFLISFVGLLVSGSTINFVSLFSLILAVGILVDSGIVVVEAIHTRSRRLGSAYEAALSSLKEYAWPLMGGTMTTVAVFVPLFFISGIVGEFIASIPFTLIFVLIASIFVALGLIPLITIWLTREEKSPLELRQEAYFERFTAWYAGLLNRILDNRGMQKYFLVGIVVTFFASLALPITGLVPSVFFPQEDSGYVYIEIEAQKGTPLAVTDLLARRVEEALTDEVAIESFTTTVGASSQFNENPTSGANIANITLVLVDENERKQSSTELVGHLREELSRIPGARIGVFEPNNGPPTGAPVLITFSGDDLSALEQTALVAEAVLENTAGAAEVTSSAKDAGTTLSLTVDRVKAANYGVTPLMIAQTLRFAVEGVDAATIETGDEADVRVRLALNGTFSEASDAANATPDALRAIPIPTTRGTISLGTLVDIELSRGKTAIRHEDRTRIETVSSYVEEGANALQVSTAFEEKAKKELTLPHGVSMKIGGETEEVEKSFREMGIAFLAGMILMFAILVLEFNSFRHTLYLLSIVPLSLIGVFLGLFITSQPLSFSSLLGCIALAGVIINHGIILLDSVHRFAQESRFNSWKEVVIAASTSRLRAIFLTTITTVIGMVPLARASAMWGPLAFAIMFGLLFATILTLVHIPILAYRWPGTWRSPHFGREEDRQAV